MAPRDPHSSRHPSRRLVLARSLLLLATFALGSALAASGCGNYFTGCEAHLNCPLGGAAGMIGEGGLGGEHDQAGGSGEETEDGGKADAPAGGSWANLGAAGAAAGTHDETGAGGESTDTNAAADGSGEENTTDPCAPSAGLECQEGTTCVSGVCRPHVCTPNALFCLGQDVMRCHENGLDSSIETQCVGQACLLTGGTAACSGVCTPAQTRCSGNGVQTCNASGQWGPTVACPASEPKCSSGSCGTPPSCSGLPSICGATQNESCCTSPRVEGGPFNVLNDPSQPATVSSFRLDNFEATVGRFRQFVDAVVTGWRPSERSGRHTHVNGGSGLSNTGSPGTEGGWLTAWNSHLHGSLDAWNAGDALACSTYATWTPEAFDNEQRPINCVNWYQAYAFCIWDGGFLPSDNEWIYAAVGGSEQRVYPWGDEAPSFDAKLAVYGCFYQGTGPGSCTGVKNIAPVGSLTAGNGRYGQSDLLGNVPEWTLDFYNPALTTSCTDCAHLYQPQLDSEQKLWGSSFSDFRLGQGETTSATSSHDAPTSLGGVRCARVP